MKKYYPVLLIIFLILSCVGRQEKKDSPGEKEHAEDFSIDCIYPEDITINQPHTIELVYTTNTYGEIDVKLLDFDDSDAISITFVGQEKQMTIKNSVFFGSYKYIFTLTAEESGSFTIQPFKIMKGAKTLGSPVLTFTVSSGMI